MNSHSDVSSSRSDITPTLSNMAIVSSVGDYTNPLYLHHSNSLNTTPISCVLTGCDNYSICSCGMCFSLFGKNKLKFVEGVVTIPVDPDLAEK